MEQKKKKQEDVLVVRDEKTGEISVVAGLDARGYPKRAQAKAEHSQEFLRFDRHGDAIDNFMRNFYRQCKEPTRFGFYRVAADTVEALLPVIKDLLKDPVANADLLAPHKVDTSAYQQAEEQQTTEEAKKENAETETEEQQAAEEVKRENAETETEEQQAAEEAKRENGETETEEQQAAEEAKRENTEEDNVEQKTDDKMEEMKQKNQEQQPQTAETQAAQGQEPAQEGQAQANPQKANLIADSDVDWKELEQFGVKRENLSEKDMKALMNYGKTGLVTVTPTFGGDSYELQARLSFQKTEDGKLKLTPHFVRHEPRLDIPHNGYTFTDEDRKKLKQTGNLGKLVDVADTKTGEMRPSYISIDRLTNEIVDIPASKVRIPDRIGLTELLKPEQEILRAGLALPKEVTLKNGRKFEAVLQVSAEKRDVEFVPEHLWQGQSQRRGNGQEKKQKSPEAPDATGQQQKEDGNQENGQRRNRSWTNEDGSIRPIGKWKDDKFTEQQKADYVAGKVVVLANAKDDKGQPCTKYLKFDREKGRPLTYSENPDLAQTVAPSNESRTQLAVNNEGKTNEATKHLKEPLTQGQTAPKDDAQKQQQEKPKKSKGMKVS
ncbi:DUF4099 domain-containing protein [Phocaeicola massiliensis]|uniref:DUF4099 domain-containing protein n=1 Tax=Phocaeicola massiliensis TaxID=204516 RepID=UPI00203021CB|nr:DUF4099 domain-containing protein [Phocaeicola massiliensis]MCM1613849.1 DUF3945 domain-containing protein [Phocaeicola massiliensis]MCM1705836.1 DUF3945 domain-containing protein [Phocaeicola massiliensis]